MVGRFGFLVAPGWGEGRFLLVVFGMGGGLVYILCNVCGDFGV